MDALLVESTFIGLILGVLLGLTGAGGSLVALPLLLSLHLPLHDAIGVSLGAVALSALVGAIPRARQGQVAWRPLVWLTLTGWPGNAAGQWLGRFIPDAVLILGFCALVLWSAWRMWRGSSAPRAPGAATGHVPLLGLGLAVGLLSGLMGVGGGFLIVPGLLWFTPLSMLAATATSMAVIALVSGGGFLLYLSHAQPPLPLLAALAAGGALGGAAYAVLTRPYQSIGDFFLANAVEGGGGHNVVNVILVDFRGFDTLGEVCVLVVTALAVQALLKGMRLPAPGLGPNGFPWSRQGHPLLLSILARLMLPLTLMVAVFILLRGHNLPGGGFIAALVTAVALLLQYVANGVLWTEARITLDYRALAGAGVALAGLAGVGSWAFGAPFLTGAFGHFHLPLLGEVELATAMVFDLGVYLAVIGVTLLILSHLGVKHREMQPEQQDRPGLQEESA